MSPLLKLSAAGAAALLLLAFGGLQYSQYRARNTQQAQDAVKQGDADEATRQTTQSRVDVLAKDGCQAATSATLDLHAKRPIRAIGDFPQQLRSDLTLCLDRGIIYAYLKGSLADAGLLKLLKPST